MLNRSILQSRRTAAVLFPFGLWALAIFCTATSASAYVDCNQNGLPDQCDLPAQAASYLCAPLCAGAMCERSTDCNQNLLPDECETGLLNVRPADSCADAPRIDAEPGGLTYHGTTVGADSDGSAQGCKLSGSNGSPSVFYLYRAPADGTLEITLCGEDYPALLSVHSACPATPSREIACRDTSSLCAPVTLSVQSGKAYFLRIAGAGSGRAGRFTLKLRGPAAGLNAKDCDQNSVPDSCQPDQDSDTLPDSCDNCPLAANAAQRDADGDGAGDACDSCPLDLNKRSPGQCGCGASDIDSDTDGSADCADQCPKDGTKTLPGICGCGTADGDSDRDGVHDCRDECPYDGEKALPGGCGCGVPDDDADGDGVFDCVDECPRDRLKTRPGICGCSVSDSDQDLDGTADCRDMCASDPRKTAPGTCGCGVSDIDSDGDGTADCRESCPTDPLKTVPGTCGCLVPDSDNDLDGTADCRDLCPTDRLKVAPGTCGCSASDRDSDADGRADCQESCPSDPAKSEPGICGCGTADTDINHDNVYDCICAGVCDPTKPLFDEDGDGVPNCEELQNNTLACDRGSFVPRLGSSACGGANGFLAQTNVLSLVNHLERLLTARVQYLDQAGALRGDVTVWLNPLLKYDLVVGDLGLKPDTIGTVCVTTDAAEAGSWSGSITVYKPRFDGAGRATATNDFALNYPLSNAQQGRAVMPLNTYTVGTLPGAWVANWVRISDAVRNDGAGLRGSLEIYNQSGRLVGMLPVETADGGSQDLAAHELLGPSAIGTAVFMAEGSLQYYMTAARYFYEGAPTAFSNFYTAFAVPNRPPTGARITGRIGNMSNELNVVEVLNSGAVPASISLSAFDQYGVNRLSTQLPVPAHGAFHRIVDNAMVPGSYLGSAEVSGPVEAVSAITTFYHFDPNGRLEYAYAPPFVESAGKRQLTDFNTFIDHFNTLEVINARDNFAVARVRIIDYAGVGFSFDLALAPHAVSRTFLPPPLDRYGTIVVESSQTGLIVRNDILRMGQYLIPLSSR